MSGLQRLLDNYERQVALPFAERLPTVQRVWFVVYAPERERRLRFLLPEFALRTQRHGKDWHLLDVTDLPARWVAAHEYRDAYLQEPALLDEHFLQEAFAALLTAQIQLLPLSTRSVCALHGLCGLFGFARVAALVSSLQDRVPGRLVCFFPGSRDGNSYHFMNARDGWNYHALPITDEEGFLPPPSR